MGRGEEGHQSPKYFRRLGDLGISDLGVVVSGVRAELQSRRRALRSRQGRRMGWAARGRAGAACPLPGQSAVDVPELSSGTWELLAWTEAVRGTLV